METTVAQFNTFKKCCNTWVKSLGLLHWQFHYELDETDASTIANVEWIFSNKLAVITLNKHHEMKLNNAVLNRIAFHEVCHVLLAGYNHLLDHNLSKQEFIDPVNHDVIRTLENLIFPNG